MNNIKKYFLNYYHFLKSQLFIIQILKSQLFIIQTKNNFFIKLKVILSIFLKIFLKPLEFFNKNFYFKIRKFIINKTYKNIIIEIQNKKFKIRDDIDLMTLFANEGINEILKKKGKIFLDIGAHIGKYSILYSDFYKKIYCFEPNHENFLILKENIILNKLENKVIPFKLAISDKIGKLEFYVSKLSVTHSIIEKVSNNKILVDSFTIDEFLKKNNINFKDISLIKIDAEGAEFLILKGMKHSLFFLKCLFIIEIWDKNLMNKKLIKEFLKNFGFKLKQIQGEYYLAYHENSSS